MVSSELAAANPECKQVHGVARDLGGGGIRITADQPLTPGTVLRCEISCYPMSVGIPTLLRVCWSGIGSAEGQYDLGLLFLV